MTKKKKKNVSGCGGDNGGQWQLNAPSRAGTKSEIYKLSHGGKQRLNPYYRLVTKPAACAWETMARG